MEFALNVMSVNLRFFEAVRNVPYGSLDFQEMLKIDFTTGLKMVEYEEKESAVTCSICMEDFKMGDEILITTCDHRFHRFCLRRWLRLKKTCPYCRSQI